MKIIAKMPMVTALAAAAIAFLTAACDNTSGNNPNDDTNGPTHYTGTLTISGQQVWLQNKEAKRQNDEWYYKFNGEDTAINIFAVYSLDEHNNVTASRSAWKSAGTGNIEKGILSFQAAGLNEEDLVNTDSLKNYVFKEYVNVTIDPPEVMSNSIVLATSHGVFLNREGLFLMYSSVGLESIQFVYVDRDCRITGNPGDKTWDQGEQSYFSRTEGAIDLSLKKGWNTIFRMEVFDRSSGYDNVSMGISNPNNFKWVLYQ
ncbi:MAG: hypothetical protein LBB72_06025 [Spirochaetaceae bacterium]|jgi:hypothetical protein|nr:hypothetical protein [Spirochaetaceae bacterium]